MPVDPQLSQPSASKHGPRSLTVLCLQLLVKYRDCLGDIGDIPQALLDPVFQYCNASQLAAIEDESREGRQHEDQLDLNEHWQRCYNEDFGHAAVQTQGQTCRQAYTQHLGELEAKRNRSGQRLREAWHQEEQRRQERTLKVVPVARPVKTIKSQSPHKAPAINSHLRLAKKLGLGKAHVRGQQAQQQRRPGLAAPARRGLKVQPAAFKPQVETTRARLAARNVAGMQTPAHSSKLSAAKQHVSGPQGPQRPGSYMAGPLQKQPTAGRMVGHDPQTQGQKISAWVPADIDWS